MQNVIAISGAIIAIIFSACNVDTPIFSKKITYEEALEIQVIKFTLEGKVYESNTIGDESHFPFACYNWPRECDGDSAVFSKSFSVSVKESADKQVGINFNPGVIVKSDLIESPNIMYYDGRMAFKDAKNLKEYYLEEGSWNSGKRKIKVHFARGNPDTDFYFDDLLQPTDHFEVLEIQEIKDRENSYLISGVFNATIPDGRSWLPANEQADPQVITDGSFHLIVEPLERK